MSKKREAGSPYYNGAVVRHAKFGLGTVQRSEGTGDDLKISVSFPGHGVKTLAVKYANLEDYLTTIVHRLRRWPQI